MREIRLMRIMTALISLSKTNKEKKSNDFFFTRMEVVDQMWIGRSLFDRLWWNISTQVLVAGWKNSLPQLFTFAKSPWIPVFFFTPLHASPSIPSIILPSHSLLFWFLVWEKCKELKSVERLWWGGGSRTDRQKYRRRNRTVDELPIDPLPSSASISTVHCLN